MFRLHPITSADYAAAAAIRTSIEADPVSPEMVQLAHERDGALHPHYHYLVAEDEAGHVIGQVLAYQADWMPADRWSVSVKVHPAHRNRGAGNTLYAQAERLARGAGASVIEGWCRGEYLETYEWAQRRGYVQIDQRTESVLQLDTWDAARFAAAVERTSAGGIRFETHTTLPAADLLQKLYEFEGATRPDIPSFEGPFPAYDVWRQEFDETALPMLILAFDGDMIVGESIVELPQIRGASAYTAYTGVRREYRGRGLALALKVLSIQEAAARGATRMRTNNDESNAPMLAVNAKLGYKLIPGPRRLLKTL